MNLYQGGRGGGGYPPPLHNLGVPPLFHNYPNMPPASYQYGLSNLLLSPPAPGSLPHFPPHSNSSSSLYNPHPHAYPRFTHSPYGGPSPSAAARQIFHHQQQQRGLRMVGAGGGNCSIPPSLHHFRRDRGGGQMTRGDALAMTRSGPQLPQSQLQHPPTTSSEQGLRSPTPQGGGGEDARQDATLLTDQDTAEGKEEGRRRGEGQQEGVHGEGDTSASGDCLEEMREIARQSPDTLKTQNNNSRSNVSPFLVGQPSRQDAVDTSSAAKDIISSNYSSENNSLLVSNCSTNVVSNINVTNNNSSKNENNYYQSKENTKSDLSVLSDNVILIREILQNKLGTMMDSGGMMLTSGPRDFSRGPNNSGLINNNDVVACKDAQTSNVAAANFMTHLLKVRQEMALNMSKDSDSDRHTDSPTHQSDTDGEKDCELPMNLHNGSADSSGRRSAAGSGSDGEHSPASPSSDTGNSTGSAKDQKASRLENIVGGLARTGTSPLPTAQGCKKRKLYQPIQHDTSIEDPDQDRSHEFDSSPLLHHIDPNGPDAKKKRDGGLSDQLRSMQDQLARIHTKFGVHTSPPSMNDENTDPDSNAPALQIDLTKSDEKKFSEEIRIEKKLNPKSIFSGFGAAAGGHPGLLGPAAAGLHLPPTAAGYSYMDFAKRLLQEQQDKITKEMITRDIVSSTLAQRNEIADKLAAISPDLEPLADVLQSELQTSLTIIVDTIVQRYLAARRQPLVNKFDDLTAGSRNLDAHKKTPSGRAPQVRDRATPRTVANPLSMANPLTFNTVTSIASSTALSQERLTQVYGSMAGQQLGGYSDDEKDEIEQDDALNLTVTPKKKRHKVTDTRITPRTVSRLLSEQQQQNLADLQKQFNPSLPFSHPAFPHLPAARPPFPGLHHPLLPGAGDFPFPPFPLPGNGHPHHPLNRPRDLSPLEDPDRARSASPPRDTRPPPPLIHPSSLLAAQSPELMRSGLDERPSSRTSSDDLRFESSHYSMASMTGFGEGGQNATLTPMHLRKAKLMFFWVRYPSSAILKMYFPDIKFNKNNTAQLVKWFSNFREFYYIQMEKYARQALAEGVKSADEIRVTTESELYRVLNLHYNRNNHIEVPDHYCPVVEVTLREFFNSIKSGKDAEPSWKKQIYKVIARYDEPIPEYFKSAEFLQQLE